MRWLLIAVTALLLFPLITAGSTLLTALLRWACGAIFGLS